MPNSILRAAACGAALLLSACAVHRGVPTLIERPAPLARADERELWKIAAEVEGRVLQGEKLHADPALDAYVQSVAERLLQAAEAPRQVRVRVRITNNPAPDAFVLVNGALYVSTGLLVRLGNEAQLAALLGHELTHYLRRDTLRRERAARDSAYSQSLELEADGSGLAMMAAAGYRPDQTAAAYRRLLATVAPRPAGAAASTHPRLADRVARIESEVAARYGGARGAQGIEGRETYLERTRAAMREINAAAMPAAADSAAGAKAVARGT